jgi:hypothetical protein
MRQCVLIGALVESVRILYINSLPKNQACAKMGQLSSPDARSPGAQLLQAFYGIPSERLLLEQLHYNLLFRWFVGLRPDDPIWHPNTYGLRPTSPTPRTATGC